MSELGPRLHAEELFPALALLELGSIAIGIRCGDAMVKRSPVEVLRAGTVHPGRFLVLVAGRVATVEEALIAGFEAAEGHLLDHVHLPQADPQVTAALCGRQVTGDLEAYGIIETCTAASLLAAADRAVKGADVTLRHLRLADDLGGKAYCAVAGDLTDVQTAVEMAWQGIPTPHRVSHVVIPRLHDEMRRNLELATDFAGPLTFAPRAGD